MVKTNGHRYGHCMGTVWAPYGHRTGTCKYQRIRRNFKSEQATANAEVLLLLYLLDVDKLRIGLGWAVMILSRCPSAHRCCRGNGETNNTKMICSGVPWA